MTLDFNIVGKNIKEIRGFKGKSQAELAEDTSLSASYISHIETARSAVSLRAVLLIACALKVPLESILFDKQVYDSATHEFQLTQLLSDCNTDEKHFIFDMAVATKEFLKCNRRLKPALKIK